MAGFCSRQKLQIQLALSGRSIISLSLFEAVRACASCITQSSTHVWSGASSPVAPPNKSLRISVSMPKAFNALRMLPTIIGLGCEYISFISSQMIFDILPKRYTGACFLQKSFPVCKHFKIFRNSYMRLILRCREAAIR